MKGLDFIDLTTLFIGFCSFSLGVLFFFKKNKVLDKIATLFTMTMLGLLAIFLVLNGKLEGVLVVNILTICVICICCLVSLIITINTGKSTGISALILFFAVAVFVARFESYIDTTINSLSWFIMAFYLSSLFIPRCFLCI